MTELTTIDPNNYAAMAKAMGIAHEGTGKAKSSSLARLRINHSPVMGTAEVKGKNVNVEVVSGGTYKLEIPDGPTYYATSIKLRPFMQDFKALPEKTQELIKQIKRVRVVLGTVELVSATDEKGNSVDVDATPFIWEIDNRDAFKFVGDAFTKLAKMQRLPVQHLITANTDERKLPNGNSFFVPVVSLNVTDTISLTEKDQTMFADFMTWIDNYNNYIINAWSEKANSAMDEGDAEVVDNLVDIEIEEEVA